MVFADDWHVGQVFFSMLWFFLFFIWIWLLITVFADIFRDHTMSGFAKAAWIIGIFFSVTLINSLSPACFALSVVGEVKIPASAFP